MNPIPDTIVALPNAISVHVRWMIRRDLPEILQIEKNTSSHPWREEEFLAHLIQRNVIGMVAEYRDRVVGFVIYELHKNKLEILSFAVHPSYQKRKVGTAMMRRLRDKLNVPGRSLLVIRVRETSLPLCLFLKKQGFEALKVLRKWWEDSGEDAYLFQYRLNAKECQNGQSSEITLKEIMGSMY